MSKENCPVCGESWSTHPGCRTTKASNESEKEQHVRILIGPKHFETTSMHFVLNNDGISKLLKCASELYLQNQQQKVPND